MKVSKSVVPINLKELFGKDYNAVFVIGVVSLALDFAVSKDHAIPSLLFLPHVDGLIHKV